VAVRAGRHGCCWVGFIAGWASRHRWAGTSNQSWSKVPAGPGGPLEGRGRRTGQPCTRRAGCPFDEAGGARC